MSIIDYADQLISELDNAASWPLPREHEAIEACTMGRAWRKGETEVLARHAGWDRDRPLVHDPLARRIATGFADFQFAEDAEFKAPSDTEGEQDRVDHLVEVNNMQARCHRAERIKVSEGEVWWKLHYNPAVADVPLLTFSSRRQVVPLFYGDRALAAAFWSERHREMGRNDEGELDSEAPAVVFRHVEVHCDGRIVNVLYRGTEDTLGARVELTAIPATAASRCVARHGRCEQRIPTWPPSVATTITMLPSPVLGGGTARLRACTAGSGNTFQTGTPAIVSSPP